jgi:GrpB-like predicted nucleotidyltransferase (UPF0157 family)/quercetin dioxygenase-like cupin family protein
VKIFRFEEDVSIPVSAFGSEFRIAPLTADDSRVRVQVMHIPPEGRIGRHAAVSRQMLAVVEGVGVVSGFDGAPREIRPTYAALWEPGEEHEARSRDGMTAISIEGEFEVWAMPVTSEIVVADYDPQWAVWFATVSNYVWPAVEDIAVRIDHVGSTSVPGMAAKPLIDMDIVVSKPEDLGQVVQRLAEIGYRRRGDLGVVGREAFSTPPEKHLPPHNLYAVVENNKAHMDHLLLRDLLVEDAIVRQRYADLKRRNVELANGDMEVYVGAKARLVGELLARAREERGLPPETYWAPDAGDEPAT